ncbi:hypothetical protein BD779DRAFT_791507 [Infundibulicybe gibba]|nr:hypothetical protein BD779DRAFT_791507 [Infundibulicybe gibba]
MSHMVDSTHVFGLRSILVVGGGPSGLVALRNLVGTGGFNRVELVERRGNIGGVWYSDDDDLRNNDGRPRWPTPAYPGMIGNVLPEFLTFSGHRFPERQDPHQPFPTLEETQKYLTDFSRPFRERGLIRLNTEVVRIEEQEAGGWKVLMKDWNNGAGTEMQELWDAVVVSNGWCDNPVWPGTKGLEELEAIGRATHAKWWRGAMKYQDKSVLVVGNANSSNDIAAHLAPVAKTPVYQSVRRVAFPGFPSLPDPRIVMVPSVDEYSMTEAGETPRIIAKCTDGTQVTDIDHVIVGSGYKPNPGFIYVLDRSKQGTMELGPLMSPSVVPHRIPSVHRHILYAYNPTLAFVGSTMSYTPFTIADVGSTWLALAWRGEIQFPSTPEELLVFERERLAAVEKFRLEYGNPSSLMVYSVLGNDEQEYARGLKAEIVAVRPEFAEILPEWNDKRTAHREAMFATKLDALRFARDTQA